MILVTDGLTVICLTLAVNFLTRKIPAFPAVILGTVITSLSWLILALRPTIWGAVLSLFVLAIGRDHPVAALLRIHFAARAPGTAGHVHGICLSADRHRIAHRRTVRRNAAASLWRSPAPAGDDLVVCDHGRWMATAALLWIYDRFARGTGERAAHP